MTAEDECITSITSSIFNALMGTLKPQSSGPLYNNMVIAILAVDGLDS